MRCYSVEEIASDVGLSERTIQEFLGKSAEKFSGNHTALFPNFEPQLYTIWNFAKEEYRVLSFGEETLFPQSQL